MLKPGASQVVLIMYVHLSLTVSLILDIAFVNFDALANSLVLRPQSVNDS